jgi:hypothetical protein
VVEDGLTTQPAAGLALVGDDPVAGSDYAVVEQLTADDAVGIEGRAME